MGRPKEFLVLLLGVLRFCLRGFTAIRQATIAAKSHLDLVPFKIAGIARVSHNLRHFRPQNETPRCEWNLNSINIMNALIGTHELG